MRIKKRLLLRAFCECAEGASRKMQFHTTNTFGLEVDFECSTSSDIGVTTGISRTGSTSGELAGSAHNDTLEILLGVVYHRLVFLARHHCLWV